MTRDEFHTWLIHLNIGEIAADMWVTVDRYYGSRETALGIARDFAIGRHGSVSLYERDSHSIGLMSSIRFVAARIEKEK